MSEFTYPGMNGQPVVTDFGRPVLSRAEPIGRHGTCIGNAVTVVGVGMIDLDELYQAVPIGEENAETAGQIWKRVVCGRPRGSTPI